MLQQMNSLKQTTVLVLELDATRTHWLCRCATMWEVPQKSVFAFKGAAQMMENLQWLCKTAVVSPQWERLLTSPYVSRLAGRFTWIQSTAGVYGGSVSIHTQTHGGLSARESHRVPSLNTPFSTGVLYSLIMSSWLTLESLIKFTALSGFDGLPPVCLFVSVHSPIEFCLLL